MAKNKDEKSKKTWEETKKEKTKIEEIENEVVEKRTKCEVFSRVVGYIRPVHQWNPGKQSEFKDRKMVKIDEEKVKGRKKKKFD